jgi:hypothetical protein
MAPTPRPLVYHPVVVVAGMSKSGMIRYCLTFMKGLGTGHGTGASIAYT